MFLFLVFQVHYMYFAAFLFFATAAGKIYNNSNKVIPQKCIFAIYNFYLFFSDSRSEPANTPGSCLHGETIEICSSIFSLLFTILFPKFSFFHSVEKKGSHEYNTVLPFHFTFTQFSHAIFSFAACPDHLQDKKGQNAQTGRDKKGEGHGALSIRR